MARRRFQFGIRSLFVAMTVVALGATIAARNPWLGLGLVTVAIVYVVEFAVLLLVEPRLRRRL